MSGPGSGSPWADPATPTEQGPPAYSGPPVTGPPAQYPPSAYGPPPAYGPPYGWPAAPYGAGYPAGPYGAGYPAAPYGPGPWLPGPPPGPRRPGQVIGTAVLAFVQTFLVLFASLYVWMGVSVVGFVAQQAPGSPSTGTAQDLASEGRALIVVGLASTVLLIVGGIAALTRRSRTAWLLVVAAHGVQVLLAAYWGIRLYTVLGDIPGAVNEGGFAAFALVFAAAPLVGLGLVVLGPGRRWFDGTARG